MKLKMYLLLLFDKWLIILLVIPRFESGYASNFVSIIH